MAPKLNFKAQSKEKTSTSQIVVQLLPKCLNTNAEVNVNLEGFAILNVVSLCFSLLYWISNIVRA